MRWLKPQSPRARVKLNQIQGTGMKSNIYLVWAAALTFVALVLHLACIIFGGDWYRILGAGEEMAKMDEAGQLYPAVITSMICVALATCVSYALSGAGIVRRLPLLQLGLWAIAAVFLLRSVSFVFLMPLFPDNSFLFWVLSSTFCFVIGACYAVGAYRLRPLFS